MCLDLLFFIFNANRFRVGALAGHRPGSPRRTMIPRCILIIKLYILIFMYIHVYNMDTHTLEINLYGFALSFVRGRKRFNTPRARVIGE